MKTFWFMPKVNQEYRHDVSSAVNHIIFIMNIKFILRIIWFSEFYFICYSTANMMG